MKRKQNETQIDFMLWVIQQGLSMEVGNLHGQDNGHVYIKIIKYDGNETKCIQLGFDKASFENGSSLASIETRIKEAVIQLKESE